MNKQEAIKFFGSASALANALGISRGSISQWGSKVPLLRAYQIERLTNGAIKAEDHNNFKQAS